MLTTVVTIGVDFALIVNRSHSNPHTHTHTRARAPVGSDGHHPLPACLRSS